MEAIGSRSEVSAGHAPALYVTGYLAEEPVTHDRVFVIGRSPTADFELDGDCRRFSRRCVELRFESQAWWMRNVSGSNVVPYTSGPLHADLAPGTTVTLDRPSYTLYFHLGDTVRFDLRLENVNSPTDVDASLRPSAEDHTVVYPELSDRERAVAAAILEPLLRDPTLHISSINSDKAAAATLGSTTKAVEHVVKSLRTKFVEYEGAGRGADRFQVFDFLRRNGIVTAADPTRNDQVDT